MRQRRVDQPRSAYQTGGMSGNTSRLISSLLARARRILKRRYLHDDSTDATEGFGGPEACRECYAGRRFADPGAAGWTWMDVA